jgi:hypothetical protein
MAKHSPGKRLAIGTLGVFLILIAPIVGVLPGPGGIPLILTGLGLLSINEPWAQKLLMYAQKHSESVQEIFFPPNKLVQWAWDLFVLALIVGGTLINIYFDEGLLRFVSIPMFGVSTFLFLMNRQRIEWINKKIRKQNR